MSETLRKWFPRFRRTPSKGSPTPPLPFNSSLQEAEGLAQLRAHPRWKDLQALLERVAQQEYDRLGDGLGYEEYLAQVGAYQASRRAIDLVDLILEKAETNHDRTADAERAHRDHTRRITYGTPFWRG